LRRSGPGFMLQKTAIRPRFGASGGQIHYNPALRTCHYQWGGGPRNRL